MRIASIPLKKALPILILGLPFFLLLVLILAVGLVLATLWATLRGKRKGARLQDSVIWEHARWFETGESNASSQTREVRDIEIEVEDPRARRLKLIPGGDGTPPSSGS
jgi:hypothetical protein